MSEVYVLSGREFLGNSEWGYGCDEVSVWGVFEDFEKAKEAFKNKVFEIAKYLAENEDDFHYTEDTLFKPFNDGEHYGWDCAISECYSEWSLTIPETDNFEYGFWFQPIVTLQICQLNKLMTL